MTKYSKLASNRRVRDIAKIPADVVQQLTPYEKKVVEACRLAVELAEGGEG